MQKIAILVITLILASSKVQAGFSGSQLAYSAGYSSPLPYAGEDHYNTPCDTSFGGSLYAAPAPVAPFSGAHHPYATFSYSTPPIVKIRGSGGGFRFGHFPTYASSRSHHKFAFPAPVPVPSVYNAPPSVNFDSPPLSYNGFEAPNTVLKFGPPITTTTTSYSTTAAAGVPVAKPLSVVAGW